MPEKRINRGRGCLVIDLQGPFALKAEACGTFVTVDFWPDVTVIITSEREADDIIAVMEKAKILLPKKADD